MSFQTNFLPASNTITSITKANPGIVTTATNHGYDSGIFVRIVFPPRSNFGMEQVNDQSFQITVLTLNTFSLNVDTSNFDSFALGSNKQVPQCIPMGNIKPGLLQPEDNAGNIIPEL